MKTSELIEHLEQVYAEHGDQEIVVHIFDGAYGAFEEITGTEVNQLKHEDNKLEIKHKPII